MGILNKLFGKREADLFQHDLDTADGCVDEIEPC